MGKTNRVVKIKGSFGVVAQLGFAAALASSCNFQPVTTQTGVNTEALTEASSSSSNGGSPTGSVQFSQLAPSIAPDGTLSFTLVARTATGAPIVGAPIVVTLSNGVSLSGATDANGAFTGSVPHFSTHSGNYTLSAQISGTTPLSASTHFAVAPAALDHIAFTQPPGNLAAGQTLSFGVGAYDEYNNIVPGVAITAASGSMQTSGTTSAQGSVSLSFPNFSTKPGSFTLTVSAASVDSLSQGVTVSAGAASALHFVTQPGSRQAGVPLTTFSIGAQDSFGNAVLIPYTSSCSLALSEGASNGPISGPYQGVMPGGSGIVSFAGISFAKVGTYALTASCVGIAGSTPSSTPFTIGAGAPSTIHITSTLPSSLNGGQALSVSVSVADALGNPIPSGLVSVSLGGTGGTLSGASSASLSNGAATFSNLSISTPTSGNFTLTFALSPASFTSAAIPVTAVAVINSFTASSQSVTAGQPVTLSWVTTAASSVMVSGVSTPFNGGSGSAQVTPTVTTAYTLTAKNADGNTATSLPLTITVSQAQPSSLVFVTQPQGAQAGAAIPAFTLQGSSSGTPVPLLDGTSCTLGLATNSSGEVFPPSITATAAGGLATFSGVSIQRAGTYTFTATCAGITAATTPSDPFTITAGPLAEADFQISTQPPANLASGQAFSVQLTGTDQYANPVTSGTVTATIATSPTGTALSGTTQATFSAGTATFGALVLATNTSGQVTLTFQSGPQSQTSSAIQLSSAPLVAGKALPIPQSLPGYNSIPSNGIISLAFGGNAMYISGPFGLGVSTDVGQTFSIKTAANGLPAGAMNLAALGSSVFAYSSVSESNYTGLYISNDSGNTFHVSPAFANATICQVLINGSSVYVVSYVTSYGQSTPAQLSVSTDGGSTFVTLQTPAVDTAFPASIYISSDGSIYVTVRVSSYPSLAISHDGGTTFSITPSLNSTISQVYATGKTILALSQGMILVSQDDGATFAWPTTPTCNPFSQCPTSGPIGGFVNQFAVSNGVVYAAVDAYNGAPGGVYISTDGGQSFSAAAGLANSNVTSISVVNGTIYVNPESSLYVSVDGGQTFTAPGGNYVDVVSMVPVSGGVYVLGNGLQYVAAGQTQITRSWTSDIPHIWASDPSIVADAKGFLIIGGGVDQSEPTNAAPLEQCNASLQSCTVVPGLGSSLTNFLYWTLDVISSGNRIYVFWRGPANLNVGTDPYGNPVNGAIITGLSVSVDGGNTFTDTGWFAVWSTQITINPVATSNGNVAFTADNYGIFATTDGGKTFPQLKAFPAVSYWALAVSGNSIYAISDGALGVSNDGGKTLAYSYSGANAGDVAATPGAVFLANAYTLLVSSDGGKTFAQQSVTIGNSGNPIYVEDLFTIGNTLYINGGSTISTDGGKTFSSVWGLPGYGTGTPMVSGSTLYVPVTSGYDTAVFTMPVL